MTKKENEILKLISAFYLKSNEFNGLPLNKLIESYPDAHNELISLIQRKKVAAVFNDKHPNQHILAYEPNDIENQVSKLRKILENKSRPDKIKNFFKSWHYIKDQINKSKEMNENKTEIDEKKSLSSNYSSLSCSLYPSKEYLKTIVIRSKYQYKPYTLKLMLGEPQLKYISFNLEILENYRNDPRYYYRTNDISGHINIKRRTNLSKSDKIFLQTFGFAYDKNLERRFVAVYLRYLSRLSSRHQLLWHAKEFKGKTYLHPDYVRTSNGYFPEKESIFSAFTNEISIINKMSLVINGINLFKNEFFENNRPKGFGFLLRPTLIEYSDFVHLLDKMISENINSNYFKNQIIPNCLKEEKGNNIQINKGTISLLEDWLKLVYRTTDNSQITKMIKIFKDIRKKRSSGSGHTIINDEWDLKYFKKQRQLIIEAYQSIKTLRLVLANNPKCKNIEIPEWLFKGKIWTY